MPTERKNKIAGPVIVLRTFRTEDGELNVDKQRRHLRWLLDQGIGEGNGLVMHCGGGSEGYFMNDDEWKIGVDLLAEECKGRVTSIAGMFELSAREVAKKARYCADIGIDFVQLQPPHYIIPTEDEVFLHFQMVNDAADIGIILYNAPWAMPRGFTLAGYEFTPPIFERLVQLENVEGAKWLSYDVENWVKSILLFRDEISFINNMDPWVLSLPIRLGCTGFLCADGNVAPRLALHMWNLWKNKEYDQYDEFILNNYIFPKLSVSGPMPHDYFGLGEGPRGRLSMEAAGLKLGPPFPAQLPIVGEEREKFIEAYRKGPKYEWVDWRE